MIKRLEIKQAEMRKRMERQRVPVVRVEYISSNDDDDRIAEKLAKTAPLKQFGAWIGYPRIERVRSRLKKLGFRFHSERNWNKIWAERYEPPVQSQTSKEKHQEES